MLLVQGVMRLLRDKIHLDGELLLLVLLQRPNVVRQAPSQDNEFYPLTYRLIIHSLGPIFPLHLRIYTHILSHTIVKYMQWTEI